MVDGPSRPNGCTEFTGCLIGITDCNCVPSFRISTRTNSSRVFRCRSSSITDSYGRIGNFCILDSSIIVQDFYLKSCCRLVTDGNRVPCIGMGVVTVCCCITHPCLCVSSDCGCIFTVNITVSANGYALIGYQTLGMIGLFVRKFCTPVFIIAFDNPLFFCTVLYGCVITNRNRIICITSSQATHCDTGLTVRMSVITYSNFLVVICIGAFSNGNSRRAFGFTCQTYSRTVPTKRFSPTADSSLSSAGRLRFHTYSRTVIIGLNLSLLPLFKFHILENLLTRR